MKKKCLLAILILVGCTKSDYCNCIQVKDEKEFIGKWLKYRQAETHSTLSIKECIEKDKLFDNADGNKTGRIRWAVCINGPDCSEAGMF